jgi:predicted membrane protein
MSVNFSDKKEQRKFGIVMAAAIAVLGFLRWALHGFDHFPKWFFVVAFVFLALGLVAQRVLKPVFYVWMKFALALNWLLTRVVLTIAFCLMFIPTAIVMRIARKDPLKRAWDPTAASYWEEAEEQPTELDRYLNQF